MAVRRELEQEVDKLDQFDLRNSYLRLNKEHSGDIANRYSVFRQFQNVNGISIPCKDIHWLIDKNQQSYPLLFDRTVKQLSTCTNPAFNIENADDYINLFYEKHDPGMLIKAISQIQQAASSLEQINSLERITGYLKNEFSSIAFMFARNPLFQNANNELTGNESILKKYAPYIRVRGQLTLLGYMKQLNELQEVYLNYTQLKSGKKSIQ